MSKHQCPKCGGDMQEGFILESRRPVSWFAGKPVRSFLGILRAFGVEHRQIESYRCVKCGYLEPMRRTSSNEPQPLSDKTPSENQPPAEAL